MQIENPCPMHEGNQIAHVCMTKQCELPPVLCTNCIVNHDKHTVIPYAQFMNRYKQFHQIVNQGNKVVQNGFMQLRKTFELCAKKAQERVTKDYVPCANAMLPNLDSLQTQQLCGVVQTVSYNEDFQKLVLGSVSATDLQNNQQRMLEPMSIYLQQLNTNVMAAINKFMSQIQLSKLNSSQSKIKQKPKSNIQQAEKFNQKIFINAGNNNNIESYFHFSEKYKPKIFQLEENRLVVCRNTTVQEGLSMYAVVDQPLSKENDTISFAIISQEKGRRFIYVGVCDAETFKAFNYKNNLYQKGNKMYAIRQSTKEGFNGVCLHNSLQQYSNKDKVPWDFQVGDIISIKYDENKNLINFIKNEKFAFQMPLDKSIPKFYPFVGLKFNKDAVRIIPQKKQDKNKGFLGFFKSAIK